MTLMKLQNLYNAEWVVRDLEGGGRHLFQGAMLSFIRRNG